MKWHDSVSGRVFWEPPGGGIEEGESPREAAIRELREETGLAVAMPEGFSTVERDYDWLGKHYHHLEAFFWTSTETVAVALTQPTPSELATFVEMRFVSLGEIAELREPLEPPTLERLLREDRRFPS
jgi:8-oxo-dGTP pyrophosphatase MutT (NUDIX family)